MKEIPRRPIVSGREGPGSRAVAKVGLVLEALVDGRG